MKRKQTQKYLRKRIAATGMSAILASTTVLGMLPTNVFAVTGSQVAADGTYTNGDNEVYISRRNTYTPSVTVSVADGKISSISAEPNTTNEENLDYFNDALKGIKTALEGQAATQDAVNTFDAVSGASVASDAIKADILKALEGADAASSEDPEPDQPTEDKTFEIDAYSGYTMQNLYESKKADMDAAAIWKFTTISKYVGGSTADTADFAFPTTVKEIQGYDGNTQHQTQLNPYYYGYGDDVVFQNGCNTTVTGIDFRSDTYNLFGNPNSVDVTVQSGANVTFKNCTFEGKLTVEDGANVTFDNCTVNYKVSFDANGGSGAPAAISGSLTSDAPTFDATVPSTVPTRDGYKFLGYATSADAASAVYQPGDKISLTQSNATVQLYAVWQDTSTYVVMNIPYDEFYASDKLDADAVTSATKVKTRNGTNEGLVGGSYHVNADGSDITGVAFPVKVKDATVLDGLKNVTDEADYDITITLRGKETTRTYSGADKLFENAGTHAYYTLSEAPQFYKELTVDADGNFSFSEVKGVEKTAVTKDVTMSEGADTHHTDYEFAVSDYKPTRIYGAVLHTSDGDYALRHLENIWRGGEFGFNTGHKGTDAKFSDIEGKTLTGMTVYAEYTADGTTTDQIDEITFSSPVLVKPFAQTELSASAKGSVITVTGLPDDIKNAKAEVTSGSGRNVTTVASDLDVVDGKIALPEGTDLTDGTTYTVTVGSDNYAAVSASFDYQAEPEYTYLYAGLTWAEYWAAEGVENGSSTASSDQRDNREDLAEYDLGAFDAVSRASTRHGMHRASYQAIDTIVAKDGSTYQVSHWTDSTTAVLTNGKTITLKSGTITDADGETHTFDHHVISGWKYVPVKVKTSDLEAFKADREKKELGTVDNGGELYGGYGERQLQAYGPIYADVSEDTYNLKTATKNEDGTFSFSAASKTGTKSGVDTTKGTEDELKTADLSAMGPVLQSADDANEFGTFLRLHFTTNYADFAEKMQAVKWQYYGNDSTYTTQVGQTYGTKFGADNWMHGSNGIQVGLTKSERCTLPDGYDGTGYWKVTISALGYKDATYEFKAEAANVYNPQYVVMNIPYDEFYASDKLEADAVTSATKVKTRNGTNEGLVGGSYHVNADGSDITGVAFPVKISNTAVLENLKDVTDEADYDITITLRGRETTRTYSGVDKLFENAGTHAYYKLSEAPQFYKELTVDADGNFTFSDVKGVEKTAATKDVSISEGADTHHTDYEFTVSDYTPSRIYGAVLHTSDGDYALRHLENIWRGGEFGFNTGHKGTDAKFSDIEGKTLTGMTVYAEYTADGTTTDQIDEITFSSPVLVKSFAQTELSASAKGSVITVTGLPEDIKNAKAEVTSGSGRNVTTVASDLDVVDGKVTLPEGTTLTDGTTYTVTVASDNYAAASAGFSYTDKITFTDVNQNQFFYESVNWAAENNISAGYEEKDGTYTFRPNSSCTRAQFVTFLWRTMGQKQADITENPFTDMPNFNNQYYAAAVLWSAENHIVSGYGDGTFGPDNTVTRAQVVTFLWRAAGSPETTLTTSPFSDVKNPKDHYYGTAMRWAYENGIVSGYGNGTFGPDDECTRGQVMTFLYRFAQKYVK